MNSTTFSLLIDVCNAEYMGDMTAEKKKDAEEALKSEGLLESVDYAHLVEAMNSLRLGRTSIYTAQTAAIDSMFAKEFSEISTGDWEKLSNYFAENLGLPDTETKYTFPSLAEPGLGVVDSVTTPEEAAELDLSPENREEYPPETLFPGNKEEVAPETAGGLLYEVKEGDGPVDEYSLGSANGIALTSIFYTLTGLIAAGTDRDETETFLRDAVESSGADWTKFYAVAEEIVKKLTSEAGGYTADDWERSAPEFVTEVEIEFSEKFEDIFLKVGEKEQPALDEQVKALEKDVIALGDPQVSLYLHTDATLEDLAATGTFDAEGNRNLRKVTSTATFDENFMPDDNGIFSEKLFGPLVGQMCSCGECNNSEPKDAREDAVCPTCHEPIMTSKDRNSTYALVDSPFPLLMGRNSLVAAMLDPKEWLGENATDENIMESDLSAEDVVDMFENCSPRVFYSINKETGEGKICCFRETDPIPNIKENEERIYGTHGLEKALESLAGREVLVNGKKWDLPIYNALKKVQYWDNRQRPTENSKKATDFERSQAQRKWIKAVNNYRAIRSFIYEREADPAEILVHYLLITPPNTRPLNNRNSTTDYGEVNQALLPMISDLLLARNLLATGAATREEFLKLERDYAQHSEAYTRMSRDDVNKKNKLVYSQLLTVKADNIVRGVINPGDQKDGQAWYKKNTGLDIPTMDLIGLPRSLARNMYREEIRKLLSKPGVFKEKPEGYTRGEIDIAFLTPPNSMETLEDGTVRRCLVDRALEKVMINYDPATKTRKGQIVSYNRQPIITNGSIQAGYAYLHDGETLIIAAERTKAMNADFDGDQIMAIKATSDAAREELKRHMNQTLFNDGTGELLVGPKLESLIGLYKISAPPETYTFGRKVIINSDRLKQYEKLGYYSPESGRMMATKPLLVNHVVAELKDGMRPAAEDGKTIMAGEPYAFLSDGTPLLAEENLVIKEADGRKYAVTPFEDYLILPQGSVLDTKRLVIPEGEKLAKVFSAAEDAVEILRGLEKGFYSYNQPITLIRADGAEERTTPGRVALEMVFGHPLPFGEKPFKKKDWNRLITDEIESVGRDNAKDVISRLTHFGFSAVNYTFLTQSIHDFPTALSVDKALYYSDTDEHETDSMVAQDEVLQSIAVIIKDEEANANDPTLGAEVRDVARKNAETDRQLYNNTLNHLLHERDARMNESRAAKYSVLIEKNAELIKSQYVFYKNCMLKDSIEAGVKGWNLLTSMVDKGITKDYQGNVTAVGGGSMVHGDVGITKVMNDSTAPINGNKTIDVAEIGGISNYTIAPAMAGMKYETADCKTTLSECKHIKNEEDLVKTKRLLDGRTLAENIYVNHVKVAAKGETLTPQKIDEIYAKGGRYINYRSALTCSCAGVCSKCAGTKIPGGIPSDGADIGITARQSFIEPSYQGVMNRAKSAGEGTKEQKGSKTISNLLEGKEVWQMDDVKDESEKVIGFKETSVFQLARRLRDSFYTEMTADQFPPLYAELVAKAFVRLVDQHGLPHTLSESIQKSEKYNVKTDRGVIISNPGMFINSKMGSLAKDNECTRFGAYKGDEAQDIPLVRRDTEYAKTQSTEEAKIARELATAVKSSRSK